MNCYLSAQAGVGSAEFGHIWRDDKGAVYATVRFGGDGHVFFTFDNPDLFREVAAACIAAAEAMEAFPPAASKDGD